MFNTKSPSLNELPTSRQLLRSTIFAAGVAGVLLVTVVMPSEYAIDPTGIGRVLGLTQMGEIKSALAQEAASEITPQSATTAEIESPDLAEPATAKQIVIDEPVALTLKSDVTAITLKPGEASEIKLEMLNKAEVSFEWSTNGNPVNHDTHGEPYNGPNGYFHSYSKGKQVTSDQGEFTAIFDGTHGWFWRNRSDQSVTITLKTKGEYISIKRMI